MSAQEILTPRQLQVIKLIAEGKNRKEIAGELGLSLKTVEYHLNGCERGRYSPDRAILQRLGTTNVAILTQWALKHGIARWVV